MENREANSALEGVGRLELKKAAQTLVACRRKAMDQAVIVSEKNSKALQKARFGE